MRASTALWVSLGLVCGSPSLSAQILPADRTTVWQPGVVGGIPNRTTICATLNAATYGNGSLEASAAIQTALDTCPSGQVVKLSAGSFTVNNHLLIHTAVTLRGAGAGTTILRKTNGARARLSSMYLAAKPTFFGSNPWPWVDASTGTVATLPGKPATMQARPTRPVPPPARPPCPRM